MKNGKASTKNKTATGAKRIVGSSYLTNEDVWFTKSLESLIGGEIALVNRGKQKVVDRKMLRDFIDKHL